MSEPNEMLDLSAALDDVSKTIAEYWATGAGGDTVSGERGTPTLLSHATH